MMNCERCGKEVRKSFGHDRDHILGSTVESGDTGRGRYHRNMDQTEVDHILCLKCYPEWKKSGQVRSTRLT